jgi:hypothetical protein
MITNRIKLAFALTVLFGALDCASTRSLPDEDLSAKEHERAAAEDRGSAREMANRFDNRSVRYVELYPERPATCDKSLPGSCSPYWTMTTNPSDRELSLAAAYQTRARRHRKAAEQLRQTEAKSCLLVSLADQDMSPLLRQRDIAGLDHVGESSGRGPLGVPAGAAIAFRPVPDLSQANLQRIVDCHLARNAALGWDQSDNSACPLNVKGAHAKVRTADGRLVVEVTSTDAGAALEILKRARALWPDGPISSR